MSWRENYTGRVKDILNSYAVGMPTGGKKFFLDPVNGNDANDGLAPDSAMKTLPVAYGRLTANKNDVLFVLGGASSLSLTTNFVWAKNYCHMVGVGAELHNGGRVRISHAFNNALSTSYIVEISARGCIFHNIHFQFGRGSANNLIGIALTYNGNQCCEFSNCDFEGPLHATEAAAAFETVHIGTGSQDNTFKNCRFGQWTIQADLGSGYEVTFAGGGNGNAVTYFENCHFMAASSGTGHMFVNAGVNLGGENSMIIFNNCLFTNTSATLTKAINPPTSGVAVLKSCAGIGFTDWSTTGNAHVQVTMPATNEAGGIGTNPA